MRKVSSLDLISLALICFLFIFSAIRFNYLPQFFDGYYHLSVANGFIQSGGWIGWSWWDFAPLGRPQLYPPLYHLLLVFCQKIGLSGLTSIRITEVLIVPVFFFFLWYSLRFLVNKIFSFFTLFTLSSFFAFYSSVSGNVPATLAVIFGLLSWVFIKKKKTISATIFLILAFYTHAAIPWIFSFSLLFLIILDKEYRRQALKTLLLSLFFALPFLFHEFEFRRYINIELLEEAYLTQISIFILCLALIYIFSHLKNKDFPLPLFWGYLLGSILIFAKYPYRLFSAQGILGFAFFSSFFLQKILVFLSSRARRIIVLVIIFYLFFLHSTIGWQKKAITFSLANSTYYNFITGKSYQSTKFTSFFFPQFYYPVVDIIKENTDPSDIISSNMGVIAQVFSALTMRPSSNSMLGEVKPENMFDHYRQAKLIIWLKPAIKEETAGLKGQWRQIYENDLFYIFANLGYKLDLEKQKAPINFIALGIILLVAIILLLKDNLGLSRQD